MNATLVLSVLVLRIRWLFRMSFRSDSFFAADLRRTRCQRLKAKRGGCGSMRT